MKSAEEIMEILEAYDLTGSLRDAAELAGCSHHTVARYVAAREQGRPVPGAAVRRGSVTDPYLEKLEELVDRSKGKIRADVAHEKITAMGYAGSERTTRRAVAQLKAAWAAGRRRVHRPWAAEPGMWAQYDFGDGPRIGAAATVLFCFWLAWSRFRVVIPLLDKSQPSVLAAVDVALRRIAGCPACLLTGNEKTVTVEHVAGLPVRNAGTVAFARHYGLTVATCVPCDPASKGGSEATVRVAKADLVPTQANLLPAYRSFAELEEACAVFCGQVNARPHRVTRRAPAEMLAEEQARLHPVPAAPFTAALGVTRKVDGLSLVSFEAGQYSVPHQLAGQAVRVRRHGEQVVITCAGPGGPAEVARHQVTTPGSPRVDDARYPPPPPGALGRKPKARTAAEAEFLAIGDGAGLWLAEAAAAGAGRVRAKMAGAVQLARLHPAAVVDRALGEAASAGRFGEGDLAAILTHQARASGGPVSRASEDATLAQGTTGWAGFGTPEVTR
ncbi:MAG: IS21/IS408/IS1162 family transposase [Streptosporangiaceae bacterium]